MADEINSRTILVSASGGLLDVVSPDGEILYQIAVPKGRVRASQYLELLQPGERVEIADGLVAFRPKSGVGVIVHPEQMDSGANPDFQPTSASWQQRKMELTVAKLAASQKVLDAKLLALGSIERIPQAPAAEAKPQADEAEGAQVVE